jgi:serine/threonine protein kinase/tetratricopeptide (TPR) repeat protein
MIGSTISHYKILEKLGEGGMGVVYKAQDLKLDRPVAVKFLPPHLSTSDESKARFTQEAKAAAALNNPNILSVYDIDEQDGKMFFVMEYVEGKTLKSHIAALKTGEGVPIPQAIDWTIQVAQGLRAAHEKNIVHRDIKPENIMLTHDGIAKIMDFGIAKLKGRTGMTQTGTSLGTLAYMSPEQAQGVSTDHRTDLWSLGAVLYEILTGEAPFRAEHEAGLLYLIVNEEPPPPSAMDKRIPRQIDPVVMKMLAKDRAQRYETARDVIAALEDARRDVQAGTEASKTKAIAVLPFGNISSDKENDYFSDGLTEELIMSLSKLKGIRVIPSATSMQYKGTNKDVKTVGHEVGTRYVLSGNVRKYQDNLRISVELIDIETNTQMWAETYKGKLADVFDFQEQVSKQIIDALMVKLTPNEQVVLTKRSTVNAEAFDCYLRGRDFLYRRSKNGVQFAIQLFQRAIECDVRYASAYAGLGEAYATLYQNFDRKEVWLEKAIETSLKALMYDPTLSEAYAALGLAYFNKKMFEEGLVAGQKAIELDPNNHVAYWILGRIFRSMDRDLEAVELFNKVLTISPDFHSVYGDLQMVYERLGQKENFEKTVQTALQVYPRYLSQHPDDARAHMYFALTLTRAGKTGEAKQEAEKALALSPDDPVMSYNTACFYARLGEQSLAAKTLQKAVTIGYENYEWMKRDPDLESVRNEPEYIELMKGR